MGFDGWMSVPPGLRRGLCLSYLCSRTISVVFYGGTGIYTGLGGLEVSPWNLRGLMSGVGGVGGWLRLLLVALPGLFYLPFLMGLGTVV